MAFPESFIEEVRQRTRLADVIGRKVKLIRKGREYLGLCPFHHEKTPSFNVVEEKGFYHCFGCGAHGDAFKFVMETEGLSFREAVERLAEEAGLPIPKLTPAEAERTQARASLHELMERACAFFEAELQSPRGAEARGYLEGRGIDAATRRQFRLGYAPGTGRALMDHLLASGAEAAQLVVAGLATRAEEGRPSRDLFRHRAMFAIRDAKGRVVAFGARALAADAKPKYLNSPETPLFHKGHTLYNLDQARKPAFDARAIIVAEGYMDVIALARAGFANAVAPLGTALTEDQLDMLWRIAPEPTLCFDGDKAGLRAAERACERAMPLLKPGQSLRFALLPGGQDPDDLIRTEGAAAMGRVIEGARPLADILWAKETAGRDLTTPERRAALEARINEVLSGIADPTVRQHYRDDLKIRMDRLFGRALPRPGGPSGRWAGRGGAPAKPFRRNLGGPGGRLPAAAAPDPVLAQNSLVNSARRGLGAGVSLTREAALTLALCNHPWLLEAHYGAVEALHFQSGELERVRQTLLHLAVEGQALDSQGVYAHLTARGMAESLKAMAARPALALLSFIRSDAPPEDVEDGWAAALALYRNETILREELRLARSVWAADPSDENKARMQDIELRLSDAEREMSALMERRALRGETPPA